MAENKVDMLQIALDSLRKIEGLRDGAPLDWDAWRDGARMADLHISFATALELRRIANALERIAPGATHE